MITSGGAARTIVLDGRPLSVRSVAPAGPDGQGWVATARLRSRVDLTLTTDAPSAAVGAATLWTRPAADGVGVAVVPDRDGAPVAMAPIPMCGCGERECGHVGRQLSVWTAGEQLLALIAMLDQLKLGRPLGDDDPVWFPADIDATW